VIQPDNQSDKNEEKKGSVPPEKPFDEYTRMTPHPLYVKEIRSLENIL
jgi:hypothetical protein